MLSELEVCASVKKVMSEHGWVLGYRDFWTFNVMSKDYDTAVGVKTANIGVHLSKDNIYVQPSYDSCGQNILVSRTLFLPIDSTCKARLELLLWHLAIEVETIVNKSYARKIMLEI